DHRRGIVVKDVEQRRDALVDRKIRQTFDGPVADVLVLVVDRAHDDLEYALLIDAAVADERKVPQRVCPRPLFPPARRGLETIDGRGILYEVSAGNVDLDARHPDGHVVRVDRGGEQVPQPLFDGDPSTPPAHARGDRIVR